MLAWAGKRGWERDEQVIARGIAVFLGAVFVLAGTAKIASPRDAHLLLTYLANQFGLAPMKGLVSAALALVIGTEVAVGVALLTLPGRAVYVPAVCLLGVCTFALCVLLFDARAPGCGCFGELLGPGSGRWAAFSGLMRNVGMLWLLGWLISKCPDRDRAVVSSLPECRLSRNPRGSHGRAFSLIEMLVVIAVIGILLAIALPSMKEARRSAKESAAAAVQRQLYHGLQLYANAYQGAFPYLAVPGNPEAGVVARGYSVPDFSYFGGQSVFWLSVVAPEYYEPVDARVDVGFGKYPPGQNPDYPGGPPEMVRSQIQLSQSCFARPSYFAGDIPPETLEDLRGTRWDDLKYPSNKGLIVDSALISLADPKGFARKIGWGWAMISFGDGSVSMRDFRPPGWEERVVYRPFGLADSLVHATRWGLAGRDY